MIYDIHRKYILSLFTSIEKESKKNHENFVNSQELNFFHMGAPISN